jgi:hypothetical protein
MEQTAQLRKKLLLQRQGPAAGERGAPASELSEEEAAEMQLLQWLEQLRSELTGEDNRWAAAWLAVAAVC